MRPIKIGITMGDPSGIGPEVISKALSGPGINRLGEIAVIGDKWVFDKVTGHNSYPHGHRQVTSFKFIDLNNVPRKNFKFGKIRREFGQAAIDYLKKAVELIKNRELDCLITAPISKQAINLAGYRYAGHTEFLARAFGKKSRNLAMMLLNQYLRVSLVTRHLALKKVSSALSREAIYKTIVITYIALREYFGVARPKICVAAFNPHAGEGGLLGREEIEKISPAARQARMIVKDVFGPLPADSAYLKAKQGNVDAVVAMYHDQALIPLKALDPDSGVNLTLGLGFVRTSPLHGTAFDIAGKNIASEASFVSAVKTAVECTNNLKKSSLFAKSAKR
ncbi:MAG: 4-hydroxythreonine-4-phosphate dehydrogenase PdxA [Candidatus Omnitrophota bacterium]